MSILERVTNSVLALCAVVVVVLLVRREFNVGDARRSREQRLTGQQADAIREATGLDSLGGNDLVVFVDIQCPYRARFQPTVSELRRAIPDVRVTYAHFPLPQHSLARDGAIALECA